MPHSRLSGRALDHPSVTQGGTDALQDSSDNVAQQPGRSAVDAECLSAHHYRLISVGAAACLHLGGIPKQNLAELRTLLLLLGEGVEQSPEIVLVR